MKWYLYVLLVPVTACQFVDRKETAALDSIIKSKDSIIKDKDRIIQSKDSILDSKDRLMRRQDSVFQRKDPLLMEQMTYGQLFNCLEISKDNSICFLKKGKTVTPDKVRVSLYYHIVIKKKTGIYEIVNTENIGGAIDMVQVSPNKRYVMLNYIDMGWVGEHEFFHERADCGVIDLELATMIDYYIPDDCGGEWDSANRWVTSSGTVLFPR